MEHRKLGNSGLMVPVLCFGTATFGGEGGLAAWGNTQVDDAVRLVDQLLDAGAAFFDTADVYSGGRSEEILGKAVAGRRDKVLLATKCAFRSEPGPNGGGTSRHHIVRACEASLRRLGTDYVDLYQTHGFDALTPVEETMRALDDLVRAGKVRYIGCSNHSGWHVVKSNAVAEKYGMTRYVSHQAYYSLAGRDYEWDLMPMAIDQGLGTLVWSPLSSGRLTGKVRRDQAAPTGARTAAWVETSLSGSEDGLYRIIDALDELVAETGKTHAQIALNWLLSRPTVTSVIFGARNEAQMRENLGATGWSLAPEQIQRLNAASLERAPYPYWHQRYMGERNPPAA